MRVGSGVHERPGEGGIACSSTGSASCFWHHRSLKSGVEISLSMAATRASATATALCVPSANLAISAADAWGVQTLNAATSWLGIRSGVIDGAGDASMMRVGLQWAKEALTRRCWTSSRASLEMGSEMRSMVTTSVDILRDERFGVESNRLRKGFFRYNTPQTDKFRPFSRLAVLREP